jgi:anti-repressor protein
MHKIITNSFQNEKVRVILIDDELWFVAKDVANVLGYIRKDGRIDTNAMIRKLDSDDVKEIADEFESSSKMSRKLAVINESGIYNSIFHSKLKSAKEFKLWVSRKVLPQIRKTGSYSLQKEEKSKYAEMISETKEVLQLIDLMKDLSPKELFYLQKIMGENSPTKLLGNSFQNAYFLPTEIGKMVGVSGAEINLILEKKGFQFRDENGVWRPTENGKEFCLEIGNTYNQLKWKLETIL